MEMFNVGGLLKEENNRRGVGVNRLKGRDPTKGCETD